MDTLVNFFIKNVCRTVVICLENYINKVWGVPITQAH